ncbi:hypothetical protein DAKH74_018820 [Maudiozyma humilis]|uniref:Zn(2)-C6 fungal-type domain-containing protein n=1 Tax=Maudiozyma humilis TaxID=51915 RepID=A0AAV5RVS7_MAUHU|nr:hypothetical protein DAKH74_018820 [Kazachstania humilis]
MGRPKKKISEQNIENFQRDIELAGSRTDLLLRDKKGRSKSCLLCRKRKQRCDHKVPSCTACLKANVKCIQPARYIETNPPQPETSRISTPASDCSSESPAPDLSNGKSESSRSSDITSASSTSLPSAANGSGVSKKRKTSDDDQYTSFLERKLKYLEKLIELPIGGVVFKKRLDNYKKITHLLGNIDDLEVEDMAMNRMNGSVMPLQQSHTPGQIGAIPEFRSPGSGSGGDIGSIPALTSDSLDSVDFSKCLFAKYLVNHFHYDPVFEFNEKLSRSFLDIFFTRLQFKYPLLDEQEIYSFHNDYTKNRIYSCSTNDFHFCSGRMWLIFSISAYMHMTTGKYDGLPPIRYFSTAVRHITKCGNNLNDVQKVELLTLLVLYLLRTDRDSMILYEIMKDIMAIVKGKLHLNKWTPQDSFVNKKLRLFWCVYLLERMICVAVGKPFTINESEIDLPLFNEDSFNTNKHSKTSGIHFINQSLRLRRIESNFVEKLNIIPIPSNKQTTPTKQNQLPVVRQFFNELEIWRSTCSTSDIRNFENETLKLYYYRAVRLLIQPYLEFLTPEDHLFRECQAAAGQICQLYKIFHQKTVNGHSTPAVHTVFGAGVTLIYCMWLERNFNDERRRMLGDSSKHTRPLVGPSLFSTMDDLRACSVCLYVMTERSSFARVFRDTFDQLMNATVGNLIERCGPDSSELIYLTGRASKDHPVAVGANNAQISGVPDSSVGHDGAQTFDNNSSGSGGMPPAVARTFGKYQAEEHVGFVENSQVDLEEQKKLKHRQGLLEQAAVPKSLAHLLVGVNNNTTSGASADNSAVLKIKSKRTSDKSDAANDNDANYIVQKPVYPNEFDWKTFQQQAFLQQQLAQQNLQAYLSSLNYPKEFASDTPLASLNPIVKTEPGSYNVSEIESNTTQRMPGRIEMKGHMIQPTLGEMNFSKQDQLANAKPVSNGGPQAGSDMQRIIPSLPSFDGINTLGHLDQMSLNDQSRGNSNVAPGISMPFPATLGKQVSGNILFDNGTHDMINHISTWTSDAVGDLVNVFPGGEKNAQQTNFEKTGRDSVDSLGNNMSVNAPHIPQNMTGYVTSTNGNTPVINGSGNISNDENIRNNRLPGQPSHGAMSAIRGHGPSNQAEEFWTINDDYGFLT